MKPIPTVYKHMQFRSRLEARWAAFFDALDWQWNYEPEDCDGWIPDFTVVASRPLAIEVKPITWVPGEMRDQAAEPIAKAQRSGWEHDVLIVGTGLLELDDSNPVVGLFGEPVPGPDGCASLSWDVATLAACSCCRSITPLPQGGAWWCRRCGRATAANSPDPHPWQVTEQRPTVAMRWAEACNATQWKRPATERS